MLLPGGYDLSTWLWPVDRERDADEVALLEQVAGYAPAASLLVVAWSRRPDVARHQADVLIRLAERLDALVALGGLIAPPEHAARAGVLVEVPHLTSLGRLRGYHLVDSDVLRGWLADPRFFLPN